MELRYQDMRKNIDLPGKTCLNLLPTFRGQLDSEDDAWPQLWGILSESQGEGIRYLNQSVLIPVLSKFIFQKQCEEL
jgi:hypothetical protein